MSLNFEDFYVFRDIYDDWPILIWPSEQNYPIIFEQYNTISKKLAYAWYKTSSGKILRTTIKSIIDD